MKIPSNHLSDDALDGLIQEFVLREGTEYGDSEFNLETKVEQVRKQLERGEAEIHFDPDTETTTIVSISD